VELYRALDDELSRVASECSACGNCCDFERSGQILFVTRLEALYVRQNVPVPVHLGKRNVCPFLDDGRCMIRPFRPLGCRISFCAPSWAQIGGEIYERYIGRLRDIHETFDMAHEHVPWPDALHRAVLEYGAEELSRNSHFPG